MPKDNRKNSIGLSWNVNNTPAAAKMTNLPTDGVEFAAAGERLARAVAGHDITARPERQTREGWQLKRIKDLLPAAFPPDGRVPSNLTLQAIQARLLPAYEKKGWKAPSTDSIARACGRRESRG
jgi:hypothetical protein